MTTARGGPAWSVERHRGSAAALHGLGIPADGRRRLWVFEVDGPAVVLGSTQDDSIVSRAHAAARGADIVRRRSGGGAVWVSPGDPIWLDIVVPRGDVLWHDDVGRSFGPIGEAWRAALLAVGVGVDDLQVHAGPLHATAWSSLVCFAGLGPGEVITQGRKVVGISQRRTRDAARFQCAVHRRWDPTPLLGVLDSASWPAGEDTDTVQRAAVGVGDLATDRLVSALVPHLT